jgi:hypothetical protein
MKKMKHVKSNVNILKPLQEKLQNNKGNMKVSKSNKNPYSLGLSGFATFPV